jgi:hypothetical protein
VAPEEEMATGKDREEKGLVQKRTELLDLSALLAK